MMPEIISNPLQIPAVGKRAMSGEADPRYEPRPKGKDGWTKRARAVLQSVPADWLTSLAPAFAATGEAAANLARCAGGKGVVVTTGQQPGLFGGPVYTLSKALTVLALARDLEKLIGIPVAPVFWAATDDSDFREASKVAVAITGGARELVVQPTVPVGLPMSRMPLGDVSAELEQLLAASGSGVNPSVFDRLKQFYAGGNTVGGAYVSLLRELFTPLGIAVLDASHESVRQASLPFLKLALDRGDDISHRIAANNAEIEKEGRAIQVQDVAGLSLVFENTDGGRKRIPRKRGSRGLRPDAELGPNVLLRPIVERQILPTIAYAGGPAEIAYFGQLAPIADVMELPRPLIVPRWSCTIVEPHVRAIVDKLGASIEDFQDPHAVETKVAKEQLPESAQKEIEAFRAAIEERAKSLASAVENPEQLIAHAVIEGLRQNLVHRIERFERRLIAASKRRNADLMQDAGTARGSLFPLGKPQERALSFIPFLVRYGRALQDAMLERATEHVRTLL
jgi:uncharacterized protein YllA (UPF0747 family)